MRTFAKSVAVITAFAVATRAIGFLFRVFLSRIMSPDLLGVYQLALSVFTVFLTLVASGLPLAISKRVAMNLRRGVVAAGLVISIVTAVVACAVVFVLGDLLTPIFGDARCIPILIALVPSTIAAGIYCSLRAVWWGERRFFLLGLTELMDQILRVVVFAVMLGFAFFFVDMAQIAAISYTVAFAIAAVVVAVIYVKISKLPAQSGERPAQYKPILKSALPITFVRVITSITVPIISVLIIKRLVACGWDTRAAMSAFGILMGMTMPMLGIPQTVIGSLSTALVPDLAKNFGDKNTGHVRGQIGNALKFTLFVNFLLIPVYMGLGLGIGLFIFDNAQSGIYISHFAWAMIPMSISSITTAILNSLGAETKAMKNYLLGALFLFASIWFLPQFIDIGALVVGIGLCMTIAGSMNLIMIQKITQANTTTRILFHLGCFTSVAAPCALLGHFLYGIVIHFFGLTALGLLATILSCAIVTIFAFLVLCHVFNIVKFNYFKIVFSRR
jgi:stage V sporulation protein B